MIHISLNNQKRRLATDLTLSQALLGWGYKQSTMLAVAINQEFVPKSKYDEHILLNGDEIDIVQAISGG